MTNKITPVIVAGGRGTRLWPLSRATLPKQFIQLAGDRTLFQATLSRVSDATVYEAPVVITSEDLRFLAAEQAREIGVSPAAILLEPLARNTAAAVAAAVLFVTRTFGEGALMLVLASDHESIPSPGYAEAIRIAARAASSETLVTFGITPTEPATGYGYIEIGDTLATGAAKVKRFVERPTADEAERTVAGRGFAWNSGILLFRASQALKEFSVHAPDVEAAASAAVEGAVSDLHFIRLDEHAFAASPDISVESALMNESTNAAVVPAAFTWPDIGSWNAIWTLGQHDLDDNVISGNATLVNTKGSLVMSRYSHLAVQGLEGVAVIAGEDAVYVARLDESQNVDKLVKQLADGKSTSALAQTPPTSYRPRGGYTSILDGERFQVKRLFVTPWRKLSLQKHHHRSEHWICVKGTAEVTIGHEVKTVHENESVYIPRAKSTASPIRAKSCLRLSRYRRAPISEKMTSSDSTMSSAGANGSDLNWIEMRFPN